MYWQKINEIELHIITHSAKSHMIKTYSKITYIFILYVTHLLIDKGFPDYLPINVISLVLFIS